MILTMPLVGAEPRRFNSDFYVFMGYHSDMLGGTYHLFSWSCDHLNPDFSACFHKTQAK